MTTAAGRTSARWRVVVVNLTHLRRVPLRMTASLGARNVAIAIALAVTCACGPASSATPPAASNAASPSPSAPPPSPSVAASSSVSPSPAANGSPFPLADDVSLAAGRYASPPGFEPHLTFELTTDDWETWHASAEFFDVTHYPDRTAGALPVRWVAFARPAHLWSTSEEVPAAGLTPTEAAELFAARTDLTAGEPVPFRVAGLDGARLDVTAAAPGTELFGGPRGDLGLQPERPARVGIAAVDGGLLLVLVLAAPDDLEAAWLEAEPIIASVRIEP